MYLFKCEKCFTEYRTKIFSSLVVVLNFIKFKCSIPLLALPVESEAMGSIYGSNCYYYSDDFSVGHIIGNVLFLK
jgi:hypothetical protein